MQHLCGRLIVLYALTLCGLLMHVLYAVEAFHMVWCWLGVDRPALYAQVLVHLNTHAIVGPRVSLTLRICSRWGPCWHVLIVPSSGKSR